MIVSLIILLIAYPIYYISYEIVGLSEYDSSNIFYMLVCAAIALGYFKKKYETNTKGYLKRLVTVCYGSSSFIYFLDLVLDNLIRTKFPIVTIFGGATIGILWLLSRHLVILVNSK